MRMERYVNFQEELNEKVDQIEELLRSFLPAEEGFAKTLAEAMNYSLCAGGKRLRPLLLWETGRLFGGDGKLLEPFMAAIEMIHTHSLIHDDLPALDNDDYRRGRLTTHKVYGEAMGILSGDALLNYAYETMLRSFDLVGAAEPFDAKDYERIGRAMAVLAKKTGIYGMLGGQSVDVENDGKQISARMLDYIYQHKTSALIEAPMMVGAILAGAGDKEVEIVGKAAEKLGLAFQIQDDILDVTSTSEELGKPVHSDEKNHKVTYVTLFGIDEASRIVEQFSEETLELLHSLGKQNEFLDELVRFLVHRRK